MRILYILIAILMLGFIVTVHEFGHYLVGRLCGIGVLEFSIGMGPKIFGFRRKGIDYSLRAIPLGGYCRFLGEDEQADDPRAMNNQKVWKRFLTVAAGPAMNFILAFIFCVIMLSGYILIEYQPRISLVYENTPAYEAGIEAGDIVVSVNGSEITYDQAGTESIRALIQEANGDEVTMVVARGEEQISFPIQPTLVENADGTTTASYQVGVAFGGRTYTFGEAIGGACEYMVFVTKSMLQELKDLIFGKIGSEGVMGPVGIISFVSDLVYNEQMFAVVQLIFILSLNIGIMNLLPLPALDGGRLIFLIVEGIRRKPVPPEKEGMVHAIGLMLLFALILFITYKDILRIFTGA